jgi:hypothetical protein
LAHGHSREGWFGWSGPAIVTVKRRPGRFGDVPDMTPEEHRRRGDAAEAQFRKIVGRAAGKD